ncbi:unnamed protein product [Lactuca saligna]|uniref:Uncharacterized protein n=1 Tax=Lactuca saligna TaxID=75948 RepID=A0AA35Y1G1_LACSI|nr:unnamed protein product [Lactuca saligna]
MVHQNLHFNSTPSRQPIVVVPSPSVHRRRSIIAPHPPINAPLFSTQSQTITNVIPLSIVLFVSLVKEDFEDWVGDTVRVKQDGFFPADLLLLASTNPDGICYIETANLDGETNLKIRKAMEKTWDYMTQEKASNFKG